MGSGLLPAPWCCYSSSSSSPKVLLNMPRQHHMYICNSDMKKLMMSPTKFRCYNNNSTNSSTPGDSDSKSVLDAFFLGKALAEAVNERVESAVGEFLSTVGRLQAEQQRQVQDFQEEVLERAKKAKEIAAREAMEAQVVIHKPYTSSVLAASDDTKSVTIITPEISTDSSSPNTYGADADPGRNDEDPILGAVPIDE